MKEEIFQANLRPAKLLQKAQALLIVCGGSASLPHCKLIQLTLWNSKDKRAELTGGAMT